MNTTKKIGITSITAVVLIALTGCIPIPTVTEGGPRQANSQAEKNPIPEATVEEKPVVEGPEEEPMFYGFNDTMVYDDGVEVTVSQPVPFTPSQWAAGTEGKGDPILFEMTITNGSDDAFDPSMAFASATSGGAEAQSIYDQEPIFVGGAPSTAVLPGKSVTWSAAFMVLDTSDITVQAAPDWDHEKFLWVGGIK